MGVKRIRFSSFQLILVGFAGVILLGAILLSFPFSGRDGEWTSFSDSLFTSTSAVCVTGLSVVNTARHWSVFGQIVILALIQIGGMGVVTVGATFAFLAGKKIGIFGRDTIKESISAPNAGGIVNLTKFIVKGVFIVEFLGAVAMMPVFCGDYGAKGIWMAIFHSISAFCNAGFDIIDSETGSLTSYVSNPLINVVIIILIIVGGIGFLVWDDVFAHKLKFYKYRLQSKVALIVSLFLVLLPAIYFFFFEFSDMPLEEKVWASLFQSVTTRTAGFNTVDLTEISDKGTALTIVLMLIGGSPGSTAGGMKTVTVALLFSAAISVFRRKTDVEILKRRVDDGAIKTAATILMIYITLFLSFGMIIGMVEGIPIGVALFETSSAIGTVGLTLGITSGLSLLSKILLIVLMYIGRVGSLTLIYAAVGNKNNISGKLPLENVTIG